MVLARFCKNVIKTSSRSYTGANYQKCVSCGTFIDFQYVWKELLFFSFVGQIQLHWSPVIQKKTFFNSPLHMTSVVHVTQVNMNVNIPTPPQPSDVTSVVHVTQGNMNVNIPPHPNPVTWRQLCMWRKVTWTLTSPPHPNPVTWRQLRMHQFQEQLASNQQKCQKRWVLVAP